MCVWQRRRSSRSPWAQSARARTLAEQFRLKQRVKDRAEQQQETIDATIQQLTSLKSTAKLIKIPEDSFENLESFGDRLLSALLRTVSFKFPKLKILEIFLYFVFFLFFPKFKKLNKSLIYWAIIVIFSVNLLMVIIYKFWSNHLENLENNI